VAGLTLARCTPGTAASAFSTRAAQLAQVMPLTCCVNGVGAGGVIGAVMMRKSGALADTSRSHEQPYHQGKVNRGPYAPGAGTSIRHPA
jgi:hypothetical protein